MAAPTIVILGSGVIGLTVAHLLANDPRTQEGKIIVVSREGPEDLHSQAFASPWAGANWSPIGGYDAKTFRWESKTFNKLWDMANKGLAIVTPAQIYYESADDLNNLWYKELVKNFRVLPKRDNLPLGTQGVVAFDTVAVNPATYLPWLKATLNGKNVQFVRRNIQSIDELAEYSGSNGIIVNASGLGSRSIMGVEDTALYPIRGQAIAVRAPGITECSIAFTTTLRSDGGITYIIPRTLDGSVLLGGTYQEGAWDTSLDASTASGILERCAQLVPAIKDPEQVHILGHSVGLRPARKGGPRVEKEVMGFPISKSTFVGAAHRATADRECIMKVIHAYGFGGIGYQNSWGAAEEVVELVFDD